MMLLLQKTTVVRDRWRCVTCAPHGGDAGTAEGNLATVAYEHLESNPGHVILWTTIVRYG